MVLFVPLSFVIFGLIICQLSGHQKYLMNIIEELKKLPGKTQCAEFKTNNLKPEGLGEYI